MVFCVVSTEGFFAVLVRTIFGHQSFLISWNISSYDFTEIARLAPQAILLHMKILELLGTAVMTTAHTDSQGKSF